jgi:3-carboxy-cis,cis-muconate cycloisomerase
MSSAATGPGLFDGVLARGRVREAVGDRAWLQAMLDFEAALARAQARAGLMTVDQAAAIGRACRAEAFDLAALGQSAADTGTPVVPLVRALTEAVGGSAAAFVHRGATSQDVVDSAAMLVTRRALEPLLEDFDAVADGAAWLAARHRSTPMAGRTLLQQAVPITFGLEAASWLCGLDEAGQRLDQVRRERLAVQLGGAAGTLAALGDAGPSVLAHLAEELALAVPVMPWHTVRTRIADLAGALGSAAGALAKPARDIVLLAQTEVGEVSEGGGRGASSAMPHKRNPIAAVSAAACAARAPGLVATLLACMPHEHQRAAGAWHAEWRALTELLSAVGAAAAWLRDSLENLEVDAARMRANLDLTGGMIMAERVTGALAGKLGRDGAKDLVAEVCARAEGRPLAELLVERAEVRAHLSPAEIAELCDPAGYLGSAELFVDRALAAHDASGRAQPRGGAR